MRLQMTNNEKENSIETRAVKFLQSLKCTRKKNGANS